MNSSPDLNRTLNNFRFRTTRLNNNFFLITNSKGIRELCFKIQDLKGTTTFYDDNKSNLSKFFKFIFVKDYFANPENFENFANIANLASSSNLVSLARLRFSNLKDFKYKISDLGVLTSELSFIKDNISVFLYNTDFIGYKFLEVIPKKDLKKFEPELLKYKDFTPKAVLDDIKDYISDLIKELKDLYEEKINNKHKNFLKNYNEVLIEFYDKYYNKKEIDELMKDNSDFYSYTLKDDLSKKEIFKEVL